MQRHGRRSWLMVYTLLIVGVLPLLLGGCGSKQNLPTWNITGGWYTFYATKGTQGEQGPSLFQFSTTDSTLSGMTDKGQSFTGQVTGVDIYFSWVGTDGAVNSSIGTVGSDGSTMSGTWSDTSGKSGTWQAVIALDPQVNVTGNWNMFQSTTGVTGEEGLGVFALQQVLNDVTQKVTKIIGTTPDSQSITGSIGRLDITFFWTDVDGVTHILIGTITSEGTTMSGTWWDTNGKSGTWRATKG